MRKLIFYGFFISLGLISCGTKQDNSADQTPVVTVKTKAVHLGDISDYLQLNGKTVYLKKNAVLSPLSGYVLKVYVKFGDRVKKNQLLYEIQTKENQALSSLQGVNAGVVKVMSPSGGVVNETTVNEAGGYVAEGTPLCNIAENSQVVIQVNVPFEYSSFLRINMHCKILLSDNTTFDGVVFQQLPIVDQVNQTQQILIRPLGTRSLPENLNLTVQAVKTKHIHSKLVPKSAVMTDETQTVYWVMKVENNRLAVKIPVDKGIENNEQVEIHSPLLESGNLVITEGAYGMNDSTVVKIQN